jgi:hypothetical protein
VTTTLLLRDQQAREQAAAAAAVATGGVAAPTPAPQPAPAAPPAGGGQPVSPTLAVVPAFASTVSFSTAEHVLKQTELKAQAAVVIGDEVEKGNVVGTTPAAGAVVPVGSTVTVYVSAGVRVPDVTNQALFCARMDLLEVRLLASANPKDAEDRDLVREQDPPAGAFVSPGATVVLTVDHKVLAAEPAGPKAAAAPAVANRTSRTLIAGGNPGVDE